MKEVLLVKLKRLVPEAVMPTYAIEGDGAMDITCTGIKSNSMESITYSTGIAMEVPKGYVGLIFPRSSNRKKNLILSNSVGVIDSGYRGEIEVNFKKCSVTGVDKVYNVGERVCQIMIIPKPYVEFVGVESLGDSKRGKEGFGSTGR